MSKDVSIKDGANLNLKGLASMELEVANMSLNYALNPDDFFGLIPRMLVKEGDKVSLGQPIFHDKNNESIKIVSPVSGKIQEIVRGAKRKILNVIIKKEGESAVNFKIPSLSNISNKKILELLIESGSLAFIRQRPYNIIARPDRPPKSIFVSVHSTAPYAANYDFILKKRMDEFQVGVDVMSKLIGKPINLSISHNCESDFSTLNNVDVYKIKGAHPSGNESFQINRIDPLNSGEIIWVIKPEDIANIGSFFMTGIFNPKRTVAVSGDSLKSPKYYDAIIGSPISSLVDSKEIPNSEEFRFINGDPLSGSKVEYSGFLGFYNNTLSVIKEGNQFRMLGWLPFCLLYTSPRPRD